VHLKRVIELLEGYRSNKKLTVLTLGKKEVPLEYEVKHHAHATKGSAANLGVWRVSLVSSG